MKKYLLELIELLKLLFIGVKNFFTLNEAFFQIVDKHKNIVKHYYISLLYNFVYELKSKSFGIGLFYNKSYGIVFNVVLLAMLAPVFRFGIIFFKCILKLIYSFYFLLINFIFDLIIKYVDVYAKKLRVFYHTETIEEINEMRRIILFINVKENFMKNFRPVKDIVIDGYVYKEEFRPKFIRITSNVALFFIGNMPLFLSFASYIIRVIASIIGSYCQIIFGFFARYFFRFLRIRFVGLYYKSRIYKYRFGFLMKKRYRFYYKFRRNLILKPNKFFIIIKIVTEKLYDNMSFWLKNRNKYERAVIKILEKKYKQLKDSDSKDSKDLKKRAIILNNINIKINYLTNYLKIPINKFFNKKAYSVNLFNFVKQFIDDKYIKRFKPFSDYANKIDIGENKSFFFFMKYGTLFHKLNIESFANMITYFLTFNFSDYNMYKFSRINKLILKIKRFLLLLYGEFVNPISIFFFIVLLKFGRILHLFISLLVYLLSCIRYFILMLLKFILFLFIVIFFGRNR